MGKSDMPHQIRILPKKQLNANGADRQIVAMLYAPLPQGGCIIIVKLLQEGKTLFPSCQLSKASTHKQVYMVLYFANIYKRFIPSYSGLPTSHSQEKNV